MSGVLLAIASWLLAMLPRHVAIAFGARVGDLARLLGVRRRVVDANLARAFPERTAAERDAIAREAYRLHGRNAAEFLLAPRFSPDELARRVAWGKRDALDAAIARGGGVILALAHYGSWELAALAGRELAAPVTALTRRLRGGANGRWVRARGATGLRQTHDGGARAALSALRRGEVVAILVDQNMLPSRGIFVDFFGAPACTTPAPAVFSLRTGAPVFAVFPVQRPDGRHELVVEGPVPLDAALASRDAVQAHTQALAALVERYVRARPEHWYWLHRRWKTAPGAACATPSVR